MPEVDSEYAHLVKNIEGAGLWDIAPVLAGLRTERAELQQRMDSHHVVPNSWTRHTQILLSREHPIAVYTRDLGYTEEHRDMWEFLSRVNTPLLNGAEFKDRKCLEWCQLVADDLGVLFDIPDFVRVFLPGKYLQTNANYHL
jgi:hypothetical protein